MNTLTPFEALHACLQSAGSQAALGQALGCSQTAIWKMFQSAKRMSHQFVLAAEELYGVSRHDLRPDIYPRPKPAKQMPTNKMVDRGRTRQFYGNAEERAA